jgi:hypothetical protein
MTAEFHISLSAIRLNACHFNVTSKYSTRRFPNFAFHVHFYFGIYMLTFYDTCDRVSENYSVVACYV